jgi:hypothetical protein
VGDTAAPGDLISRSQFHLQRPYFQMRSHAQVPGDTAFGKVTFPLSSMELDLIPIWRPGPMEWATQLVQNDLISRSQVHLQRPYFQMRSHAQVPGDTAFGKVTFPLSSMELGHIPIWWPDPMEWVTQLVQNDPILISSAQTLPPNPVPFKRSEWTWIWLIFGTM